MLRKKNIPDARQCALLFLLLIHRRSQELDKPVNRTRLAEITLKRLWLREILTSDFLAEVQEWMLAAGWALINAGDTYAAVTLDAIASWQRVSSKRLASELNDVAAGKYDFDDIENLVKPRSAEKAEPGD
jgi:hypothetical protein